MTSSWYQENLFNIVTIFEKEFETRSSLLDDHQHWGILHCKHSQVLWLLALSAIYNVCLLNNQSDVIKNFIRLLLHQKIHRLIYTFLGDSCIAPSEFSTSQSSGGWPLLSSYCEPPPLLLWPIILSQILPPPVRFNL